MKNLMKRKLLSSAVSVALIAGVGFSSGAQAIHLAENGIGQVLLAPLYLTEGSYKTSFSVVNTNPSGAVKAKVVIRSQVDSVELLDFICYLTPSDVCRFDLVKACATERPVKGSTDNYLPAQPFPSQDCDPSYMHVFLSSADDSIKSPVTEADISSGMKRVDSLEKSSTTFASVKPVVQGVYMSKVKSYDNIFWGHTEVIGLYGVRNGPDGSLVTAYNRAGSPTYISIFREMSKFSLAQIFDTPRFPMHYSDIGHVPAAFGRCLETSDGERNPLYPCNTKDNPSNRSTNAPYEYVERLIEGDYSPLSPLLASRIRSTDPTWVRLTGTVEIVNADESDRMAYRIPALAGAVGDNATSAGDPAMPGRFTTPAGLPTTTGQWDGLVVSNPTFDARGGALAPETQLGIEFGILPTSEGWTSVSKVVEIEAALAATHLEGTYEDESAVEPVEMQGKRRTRLIVTFPTRYLHKVNVCGVPGLSGAIYYPPFQTDASVLYDMNVYDEAEHLAQSITGTSFSGGDVSRDKLVEVNYFLPDWPKTKVMSNGNSDGNDFRRGWFEFTPIAASGCERYYSGLPVIGFSHKFFATGHSGLSQSMMLPLAHEPVRQCHSRRGGVVLEDCPAQFQPLNAVLNSGS